MHRNFLDFSAWYKHRLRKMQSTKRRVHRGTQPNGVERVEKNMHRGEKLQGCVSNLVFICFGCCMFRFWGTLGRF